jgi:hypothetical protein
MERGKQGRELLDLPARMLLREREGATGSARPPAWSIHFFYNKEEAGNI